jgi:hypothetical protein
MNDIRNSSEILSSFRLPRAVSMETGRVAQFIVWQRLVCHELMKLYETVHVKNSEWAVSLQGLKEALNVHTYGL